MSVHNVPRIKNSKKNNGHGVLNAIRERKEVHREEILLPVRKIHGVSVRYQNGAKQLHKNGNQLPAVSHSSGIGPFS